MRNNDGAFQENLYNLLCQANISDDDLTLEMINRIFDNLDIKDICAYHDIKSFNTLLNEQPKSLLFFHMNMRSMVKHNDDLDSLIHSMVQVPDIIAVSESWLKSVNSKFYNLQGYTSYHVTRENRKGGGASLLIKSCLNSELVKEFSFVNKDIEICTVIVRVECATSNVTNKFVISAIYRPHSKHKNVNQFTNTLSEILNKPLFLNNKVYLLGDFNINLLEIFSHAPTEQFLSSMQALNYFELISRPTRFPQKNQRAKPSLIDHIFTNNYTNAISGILTTSVSDHLPIFFLIPDIKPRPEKYLTRFRLFNEHNKNQFTRALSGVHWEEYLIDGSAENNFNIFFNKLNEIYNQYFEIKTKLQTDKRISSPWITKGIINSIRNKNKLYKQQALNIIPYERFKAYANTLSNVIRTAKKRFYLNYFSNFKLNLKKCWTAVNKITDQIRTKTKRFSLKVNGVVSNDSKLLANEFNNHFTSIASKLNDSLPNPITDPLSYLSGDYLDSMMVAPVELPEIFTVIRSLKTKKALLEDFSPLIVKENCHLLAPAIKMIYNQSVQQGIFPSKLKHALVIPLHKGNSCDDLSNYRPISQLNIFSKIFEKIMKASLLKYLTKHKIIPPTQFGF